MEGIPGQTAKQWLFAAWIAAVVFVFPIPRTIALRNLLLLAGVVALLWAYRRAQPRLTPWLKPAAVWFAALTAWILFHSLVVAEAPIFAIDQFRANWLMPFLIGAIGAWAATQLPRARATQAVAVALAGHMLWLLGWQFKVWLATGVWPFKVTPFGGYDYQGTLNSFLLALLVVDRLFWVLRKTSPLSLGRRWGWVMLVLSLIADLALQSRNSTVVSALLLLATSIALLKVRSRYWRIGVAVIGLVGLLGTGSLKFDPRWQGLRESVSFGWSSPDLYWMTYAAARKPMTPSGRRLDESAYLRSAWARQAVDFIAEHPMGIGFGHDSFGNAMEMKYGTPGWGSSHSGWLDFALGTGLVGLALLLATAGVAMRSGWREFRKRHDAQALLLLFFVGGYLLRCLLDGHLSGWRLGLFAFVVGILIAGMREQPENP